MAFSVPTLPHLHLIDGLNYIPPPSARDFDAEFSGLLPEGKSIPSSWGVTRYYDFGAPAEGSRRVVLIHGGGTPALGMAPLALKLKAAGKNHVICYDLWGHGNSSTPIETHTPALLHAQLLELLSYLKWPTAHLLGFSIGGSILASFVAIHSHVAESVTIVAGAGLLVKSDAWWDRFKTDGGWGREWLGRRTIMDFVEGGKPRLEGWRERWKSGHFDTEPVERWQRENHRGHVASLVSLFRYGGTFNGHESYRKLGGTGVNTLVILGDEDTVIPAESSKQELQKLGWKGEIRVVAGATHEIVRSHAKEVTDLVEQFWGSVSS